MRPIFVFGSNLAGRHGKGAALHAFKKYGAEYGVGEGRTGHAYAIPTKDSHLKPLSLKQIKHKVKRFVSYAKWHSKTKFHVTALGTGLAGYTHKQISPMFKDAPKNCILPQEWRPTAPKPKIKVHKVKQHRLINADCLDVKIPSDYIDLVVCDPPYGTTTIKWDEVIDFKKLWAWYERVVRPGGVIVMFGSQPFTSQLITSNLKWFKYKIYF